MREDSEGTPLLRGRPAGGLQDEGDPAFQRLAAEAIQHDDAGCGASSSRRTRGRFVTFFTRDPRSLPSLLAVAALGVGALFLTVGFMSTSTTVGEQAGDVSLTATAAVPSTVIPVDSTGGVTARAGGAGDGGGRDREGDGDGAGISVGDGGRDRGSMAASGGWRSQSERSPGTMHGLSACHGSRVDCNVVIFRSVFGILLQNFRSTITFSITTAAADLNVVCLLRTCCC